MITFQNKPCASSGVNVPLKIPVSADPDLKRDPGNRGVFFQRLAKIFCRPPVVSALDLFRRDYIRETTGWKE